jgi:hypothetical protein
MVISSIVGPKQNHTNSQSATFGRTCLMAGSQVPQYTPLSYQVHILQSLSYSQIAVIVGQRCELAWLGRTRFGDVEG